LSRGKRQAFVAKVQVMTPMTARNDHSSETTPAGGENPREPLVDRQLELDLLR
jgi:hypothetical protein